MTTLEEFKKDKQKAEDKIKKVLDKLSAKYLINDIDIKVDRYEIIFNDSTCEVQQHNTLSVKLKIDL